MRTLFNYYTWRQNYVPGNIHILSSQWVLCSSADSGCASTLSRVFQWHFDVVHMKRLRTQSVWPHFATQRNLNVAFLFAVGCTSGRDVLCRFDLMQFSSMAASEANANSIAPMPAWERRCGRQKVTQWSSEPVTQLVVTVPWLWKKHNLCKDLKF